MYVRNIDHSKSAYKASVLILSLSNLVTQDVFILNTSYYYKKSFSAYVEQHDNTKYEISKICQSQRY